MIRFDDSIVQLHKLFFENIILMIQSKSNNHIILAPPTFLIKIRHYMYVHIYVASEGYRLEE